MHSHSLEEIEVKLLKLKNDIIKQSEIIIQSWSVRNENILKSLKAEEKLLLRHKQALQATETSLDIKNLIFPSLHSNGFDSSSELNELINWVWLQVDLQEKKRLITINSFYAFFIVYTLSPKSTPELRGFITKHFEGNKFDFKSEALSELSEHKFLKSDITANPYFYSISPEVNALTKKSFLLAKSEVNSTNEPFLNKDKIALIHLLSALLIMHNKGSLPSLKRPLPSGITNDLIACIKLHKFPELNRNQSKLIINELESSIAGIK